MSDSFHVAVAGAGPAGSVLALRLAQLGKRVVLIEKTRNFARRPGESLTPGVLPLLDAAGLRARVEAAGYLRPRTAQILWAGESRRTDASAIIVNRAAFDSLLLDAAREAGPHVIQATQIAHAAFEGAWSLHLGDGRTVRAGFLADAAGRSRVLAGRKIQHGARTFALCGYWSNADCSGGALVEAAPSAWYWAAPLDDGSFSAMVFIDRAAARAARYRDLIQASSLLAPRLRNARCVELKVCDATPFYEQSPVDDRSLKVGDAALSIDPLSSQGMQTAIGTALHAAAVINTILDRPQDRELAIEFYRRRLRQSLDFHCNAAAGFYREQFQVCPSDFWRARAEWPQPFPSAPRLGNNRHPAPGTMVRLSARARFIRLGASNGSHIFAEDAVELDGKAVAYVDGLNLRPILEAANSPVDVDGLIARWMAHMPLEKARRMFAWACEERWIEAAG